MVYYAVCSCVSLMASSEQKCDSCGRVMMEFHPHNTCTKSLACDPGVQGQVVFWVLSLVNQIKQIVIYLSTDKSIN